MRLGAFRVLWSETTEGNLERQMKAFIQVAEVPRKC